MTNPQEPELPEYVSVELDRILSDWDSEKTTIITEHDVGVLIVAAKNFRKSRATPPKAEGMSAANLAEKIYKLKPEEGGLNQAIIIANQWKESIRAQAIEACKSCATGFDFNTCVEIQDRMERLKTNRDGGSES